jgi:hypothetical protein
MEWHSNSANEGKKMRKKYQRGNLLGNQDEMIKMMRFIAKLQTFIRSQKKSI